MAIKSLDELKKLRSSIQSSLRLRQEGEDINVIEILVGMGTCGIAVGARDTFQELLKVIEEKNLEHVRVISVGCIGYCYMEPTVEIRMPNREPLTYGHITADMAEKLIQKVIVEEDYLSENLLIQSFDKAGV